MPKFNFAECINSFFEHYLSEQKNATPATIATYTDALSVLLKFMEQKTGRSPEKQELEDFSRDTILEFLDYLENERGNSIRSRNARLMFVRTFFRHIAYRYPETMAIYSRIATIPTKKMTTRQVPYLTPQEVKILVESIDQKTSQGRMEYLLLIFLIQTGVRVSELCNVRFLDIYCPGNPCLKIMGKGRKERVVRINAEISKILKELKQDNPDQEYVFVNRFSERISRHGISFILKRIVENAREKNPGFTEKQISPHVLRHTNGMFLLWGGNDLVTISKWLGHSSISTTTIYVQADMRTLDQALERCSFFEMPHVRYKAPDSVLAKLDEIKKRCKTQS